MSLLTWHSLVFLIPIVLAAALLVGSALGLAEAEADADADADGDAHAEVDGDADGDAHADVEHDAAPEISLIGLLGVGRVPLSLLVTTLLLAFGGIGLVLEYLLAPYLSLGVAAWIALGVASVLAPVMTGCSARFIARWVPTTETYVTSAGDLVGCVGVVEIGIDERFGIVRVLDAGGTQIKIRCHSTSGPIQRGERALVIDYESSTRDYLVEKEPDFIGQKEQAS